VTQKFPECAKKWSKKPKMAKKWPKLRLGMATKDSLYDSLDEAEIS